MAGVNPVSLAPNAEVIGRYSVSATFDDPRVGLRIDFAPKSGALGLESSWGRGAVVTHLEFNNGKVQSLLGYATFLGIPIPGTAGAVQNKLNQNQQFLQALQEVSSFLGRCAQQGG